MPRVQFELYHILPNIGICGERLLHSRVSCSLLSLQLNSQDSLIVKELFLMTEGHILMVTIDQFVCLSGVFRLTR